MNAESTKNPSGEIDLEALKPKARGSIADREELEQQALRARTGHELRRKGRTAALSTKVKPALIETIHRLALAEGKSMVEIIEAAVASLEREIRGKR